MASGHNFRIAKELFRAGMIAGVGAMLCGCASQQSALHPAGRDAAELANLFWFMAAGAVIVWLIVMGAAIYAVLGKRKPQSERFADSFILIGGVAFPTVGLAALLVFGLSLLPSWGAGDDPDLRVHVQAEQYWWRIAYERADGSRIETANELHLPVNSVVEFVLTSTDVIHSFWIPALGGKMDAIPGRSNVLRLEPTKPGVYRGVCAEFCGPSHSFMAFPVVVHEADEYAQWLEAESQPARAGEDATFTAAGCGACHSIRGTANAGTVGPDLTHFASRSTIGAGTLHNNRDQLEAWLAAPEHVKPDVRMPPYASLPDADRAAIIDYLVSLK